MSAGRRPVIVCGAGVGGLAASAALLRQGFDVEVLEQADGIRAPSGSGLTIWGNGMTALARIGVAEPLRAQGSPLERQLTMTHRGGVLTDVPVGRIQREFGEVGIGVRRRDLLTELRAAGDRALFSYGDAVTSVRTENGCAIAVLASGRRVYGEAVIGADGLWSRVRDAILRDGPPDRLNHQVWRGISDSKGSFPATTSLMVYGSKAVRMVGWPVDADHVCWSIGRNFSQSADDSTQAAVKDQLLHMIADFPAPCRHVLEATPDDRIIHTQIYARPNVKRLVQGRVALLGDAGHAMPTVFGQGAAMAIEDAVVLTSAIARHGEDVQAGLYEYEQIRLPRLRQVRRHAVKVSKMQEWKNPCSRLARDSFLKVMPQSMSRQVWSGLLRFSDARPQTQPSYGHR
jgi:FAD-dependent urate hydroxylase